jgi:hypothetical protein
MDQNGPFGIFDGGDKGVSLGGGKGVRTSKVVYFLRDFNDIAVACFFIFF